MLATNQVSPSRPAPVVGNDTQSCAVSELCWLFGLSQTTSCGIRALIYLKDSLQRQCGLTRAFGFIQPTAPHASHLLPYSWQLRRMDDRIQVEGGWAQLPAGAEVASNEACTGFK